MTRPLPSGLRFVGFVLAAAFAFDAAVPVFADGVLLDSRSVLSARAESAPAMDSDRTAPDPGAASDLSAPAASAPGRFDPSAPAASAPGPLDPSASVQGAGTTGLNDPPANRPSSPGLAAPVGPSEAQLRAAFPAQSLQRLDPAAFQAFVRTHAGEGRMLSGMELAAVMESGAASARPPEVDSAPRLRAACDSLPSDARARCRDSLARQCAVDTAGPRAAPRALRELQAKEAASRAARGGDSLARAAAPKGNAIAGEAASDSQSVSLGTPRGLGPDQNLDQAQAADEEEAKGWFANLFLDLTDRGSNGKGMDGHDWAAVIYVVVGVVVVGAFIVYAAQTLVELAINKEHYPLFQEAGLRLSYSGRAWRDGAGTDLYRDAYLAGIRYAVGFDRPGADVGLAVEAGYIDIRLSPLDGPGSAFDFRGGYGIAGPLLRFGSFNPMCFSLEFLNGTSSHPSIGWISKARMALQYRFGKHETVGADLGAVFYDLSFLDGLAWRRGDLNRDLSLIGGLDFGWEF